MIEDATMEDQRIDIDEGCLQGCAALIPFGTENLSRSAG
jgi:hypothetical protein